MRNRYTSFQDMKEHYQEGDDYRIRMVNRGTAIIILAPHGGGIERGTSELVRAIAGDDLSYYLFEGVMRTAHESQKMHIRSIFFDEPNCLEITRRSDMALAVHGCYGREPVIYIGGINIELKQELFSYLVRRNFPVNINPERKYAGQEPMNICNRTRSGRGIQLEFSTGIRTQLFVKYRTRNGRRDVTPLFSALITAIREVII
jgi:phage replication-related protein YjqB (UPF0714/DUF867 family)